MTNMIVLLVNKVVEFFQKTELPLQIAIVLAALVVIIGVPLTFIFLKKSGLKSN